MTRAWVGLGANLGDPPAMLARAVAAMDALDQVELRGVSPAYWSLPWGRSDQPEFLNAVVYMQTELSARELLDRLLVIEATLGRKRDGTRWGPRIIDLDLLVFGEERITEADLTVPHPRLSERAFVLVPLHDLAPDLVIPGAGRVDELLAALDDSDYQTIRRAPDLKISQSKSMP